MSRLVPLGALRLSPTLTRPARPHTCRLEDCRGACCAGGIWVDVLAVQRILDHAAVVAPLLAPDRRDPDRWFTEEVMEHQDFPSGVGAATAVGPRPDGSGRLGCVLLLPDQRCALQLASEAAGLAWPGLKPFDCATFPVLRSEGVVGRDRSVFGIPAVAACHPPRADSPDTAPFFEVWSAELRLAAGREARTTLLGRGKER